MPQHACGDGTPGTPRTGDATDAVGARQCAQPFDFAHRGHEREIARRPDVGAPERHQKIDVRGPRTDSFELDQLGARALVVHLREPGRIEHARDNSHGQPPDVRALLPSESGASQVDLGQGRDPLRRHGSGTSLQPCIGGAARRQRYLLLEDDLYEGLEAGRTIPEWGRAVARDNGGEVRIPPREFRDTLGKPLGGQLKGHVYLTSQTTSL
jgi:hypothetical protein